MSVALAEALPPELLVSPPESPGEYDPHVWMDVALWAQVLDIIRDRLIAFAPEHKEEFLANARRYRSRLEALHRYSLKVLGSIPESQRIMLTAHDAFNYFGRSYGLDVRGIQGISTESEAGLKDINDLIDFLVTRKVRSVFVESSVSERNVRALVEGCRSRGHDVSIGGELFSDSMGAAGTAEGTYIGMIEHNVNTVSSALGGSVPVGGFAQWEKEEAAVER